MYFNFVLILSGSHAVSVENSVEKSVEMLWTKCEKFAAVRFPLAKVIQRKIRFESGSCGNLIG